MSSRVKYFIPQMPTKIECQWHRICDYFYQSFCMSNELLHEHPTKKNYTNLFEIKFLTFSSCSKTSITFFHLSIYLRKNVMRFQFGIKTNWAFSNQVFQVFNDKMRNSFCIENQHPRVKLTLKEKSLYAPETGVLCTYRSK